MFGKVEEFSGQDETSNKTTGKKIPHKIFFAILHPMRPGKTKAKQHIGNCRTNYDFTTVSSFISHTFSPSSNLLSPNYPRIRKSASVDN